MRSFIGDIFTFLIEKGKTLFLIMSIVIIMEEMLYFLFPQKIKRIVEKCPLYLKGRCSRCGIDTCCGCRAMTHALTEDYLVEETICFL